MSHDDGPTFFLLSIIMIVLIIVLLSGNTQAQDRRLPRTWRVTYINDIGQEIRSSTRQTLGGCIAAIQLQHAHEKHDYYCTADADKDSAASSTPQRTR